MVWAVLGAVGVGRFGFRERGLLGVLCVQVRLGSGGAAVLGLVGGGCYGFRWCGLFGVPCV